MSNLLIAISGVFTLYNILAILGGTIELSGQMRPGC